MIVTKNTHSDFPFENTITESKGMNTSGSATYADGVLGMALTNNSTSYEGLSVGDVTSFNYLHQTGKGAVSFWLKLNDNLTSDIQTVVGSTPGGSRVKGFWIAYDNRRIAGFENLTTNALRCWITGGFGTTNYWVLRISKQDAITDNNWHHYLLNFETPNNMAEIYIDGVVQTSYSFQETNAVVSENAANVAKVAVHPTATQWQLRGSLQELRFYTSPLSISDIKRTINGLHPLNG